MQTHSFILLFVILVRLPKKSVKIKFKKNKVQGLYQERREFKFRGNSLCPFPQPKRSTARPSVLEAVSTLRDLGLLSQRLDVHLGNHQLQIFRHRVIYFSSASLEHIPPLNPLLQCLLIIIQGPDKQTYRGFIFLFFFSCGSGVLPSPSFTP